jgi:hypothetical protein
MAPQDLVGVPLVAAFELAVGLGFTFAFHPPHVAFYVGFTFGVTLGMLFAPADSPPHHVERWRTGAEGEKATAKALRKLPRGWQVGWLARTVETRLGGDGVDGIVVQPVVVIWAPFEQRSILSGGVAWVSGKHLAKVLAQRPVTLTPDDVGQVAAALRRPWRAVATAS